VVVDNDLPDLEYMTAFAFGLIAALALMAAAVARVINAAGAGSAIVAKFGIFV